MGSRMKYVLFYSEFSGMYYPIIFPDVMVHADLAERFLGFKIEAAGFIYIDEHGKYLPYGESTSLKIGTKENTAKLINIAMGIEYVC